MMKKKAKTVFIFMYLLLAVVPVFALPIDSVVKVYAVKAPPIYFTPWNDFPPQEATASGCVISGKRILTNAHAVADQTFLMVRKQSSPKKYVARLLYVGHECDLAILTVDEPDFFNDLKPLKLDETLPQLNDTVIVLGYPAGGDTVSITAGVVSRIEVHNYNHSSTDLLTIQIDAAINPGNSGGPVILNDQLVGIAFQGFKEAENIGYIIPIPIIRHFLKDIEDNGKYDGFCNLGIKTQLMENDQLRKYKGMKPKQTGILITSIMPLAESQKILKTGDVLLSFDGVAIANEGTVSLRNGERISIFHLIANKYIGDIAKLTILRDGKILNINIKMEAISSLVPRMLYDVKPDYFIHAGFVFMPLTQNYLKAWGKDWEAEAPTNLITLFEKGIQLKPYEQVVMTTYVFPSDSNIGYTNLEHLRVKNINGVNVLNMKDLIEKIETNKEPYLIIDLEDDSRIILETEQAKKATESILEKYRISAAKSASLK